MKEKTYIRENIVSVHFLNRLIFILASNNIISKAFIRKVSIFLKNLDMNHYKTDLNMNILFHVIELLIEYRAKYDNEFDRNELVNSLENGFIDEEKKIVTNTIIPIIKTSNLVTQSEIDFIEEAISKTLKFFHLNSSVDEIFESITHFQTAIGFKKEVAANKLFDEMQTVCKELRKIQTRTAAEDNQISVLDENFDKSLEEVWENTNNNSGLKTGMRGLNAVLSENETFQTGLYLFCSRSGGFKSMVKEHIAHQVMKYNGDKYSSDYMKGTGKPTVVIFSFENSSLEDSQRLYKMMTGFDPQDFKYDQERFVKEWKKAKDECNSPIDIRFFHSHAKSMTVEDIDSKLQQMKDDGINPIMVIVDYIALIKTNRDDQGKADNIILKENANALLGLAKREKIPVISSQQLNREGVAVLNFNKDTHNNLEAIRLLCEPHIEGSSGIFQASTKFIFVDVVFDKETKTKYLAFKNAKSRGAVSPNEESVFFYKLYKGMLLHHDINDAAPTYFKTISNNVETDKKTEVSNLFETEKDEKEVKILSVPEEKL